MEEFIRINYRKKIAFTLAEILIVLTIIGNCWHNDNEWKEIGGDTISG